MRKQEENNEEVNKVLLDELYDIDNLKNDLDEILNIEDITVSESLIQATLKRVKEEEQSKQPTQSKQPIRMKIGIPFRYGMVAACACILLVAGISLLANPPVSMKDDAYDMASQEETTADSSTVTEGTGVNEKSDKTESYDGTSESETSDSVDYTESAEDTESKSEGVVVVPSFFDIADEGANPYTVEYGEIAEIIVCDESGFVIHNVAEKTDIESLYNTFAKIDSQDHGEVVQNESREGQYLRQYDIIASEGFEWTELHVWITNVDKETYVVTRQLISSTGEVITHQITDVSSDIVQSIINTIP